ncbi:hypothetical protein K0M31_003384 [Melipona bicolor]|uniref:Uncharacterized protein n=1 Tax=Melipona bicolor TaxID=60889 RepID=A0AA40FZE7_9HYME|nr:hypothetical protein K0M31_003384 [Melipona bicolor]
MLIDIDSLTGNHVCLEISRFSLKEDNSGEDLCKSVNYEFQNAMLWGWNPVKRYPNGTVTGTCPVVRGPDDEPEIGSQGSECGATGHRCESGSETTQFSSTFDLCSQDIKDRFFATNGKEMLPPPVSTGYEEARRDGRFRETREQDYHTDHAQGRRQRRGGEQKKKKKKKETIESSPDVSPLRIFGLRRADEARARFSPEYRCRWNSK